MQRLATVSMVVRDYDEAIAFYVGVMGFELAEDTDLGGGRVWLFLHTDDFDRDHRRMAASGVSFLESPRHEPYGTVAVFQDCYGNRWDLLELAAR